MNSYLRRNKKPNVILFTLFILEAGVLTLATLYRTNLFNSLVDKNIDQFVYWQVLVFALWLVIIITRKCMIVLQERCIQKQVNLIRSDITTSLEQTSYQTFHQKKSTEYLSWLSNDMNTIEKEGFDELYLSYYSAILVVFSSAALFSIHYLLLIASLLFALLLFVLPQFTNKKIREAVGEVSATAESCTNVAEDYLTGYDTLFQLNKRYMLSDKLAKNYQKLAKAKIGKSNAQSWMRSMLDGTSISAQFGIIIVNAYLIFTDQVSVGTVFSTGALAGVIFNYLNQISVSFNIAKATEELFDKYALPVADEDKTGQQFHFDASIELKELAYAYPEHIVRFPNMTFRKGGKYIITGASGSGKSTLLNILTKRLTDYQGSVTIDGEELAAMNQISFNDHISYVSQFPHIFHTSILENICFDDISNDEKKLYQALDVSEAAPFTKQLPQQLETEVSGKTQRLSGGQLQRIAIARGVYFAKNILILDEAIGSLDYHNALKVEDNLLEDPNLTIIFVTHHIHPENQERFDAIYRLTDSKQDSLPTDTGNKEEQL